MANYKLLKLIIPICALTSTTAWEYGCQKVDFVTFQCKGEIPVDLPSGVSKVELNLDHSIEEVMWFNSSLFTGSGWKNISTLSIVEESKKHDVVFSNMCFAELLNLMELRVHIPFSYFLAGALSRTTNIKILDLTNCSVVTNIDLMDILSPGNLPSLRTLILFRIGYIIVSPDFDFDSYFWHAISSRPITYLDISYVHVVSYNESAAVEVLYGNLRTLVARGLSIGKILAFEMSVPPSGIKTLDLSESFIPSFPLCVLNTISEMPALTFNLTEWNVFASVEIMNLDNICTKQAPDVFLRAKNITARFTAPDVWHVRALSLKGNNLAYVDARILCEASSLENLSLAENKMEFLNPDTLSCITALKQLDLSKNLLSMMYRNNNLTFSNLLSKLPELISINLGSNDLVNLPREFFSNNKKLRDIILADNQISQIHFDISHLKICSG